TPPRAAGRFTSTMNSSLASMCDNLWAAQEGKRIQLITVNVVNTRIFLISGNLFSCVKYNIILIPPKLRFPGHWCGGEETSQGFKTCEVCQGRPICNLICLNRCVLIFLILLRTIYQNVNMKKTITLIMLLAIPLSLLGQERYKVVYDFQSDHIYYYSLNETNEVKDTLERPRFRKNSTVEIEVLNVNPFAVEVITDVSEEEIHRT